MRSSRPGSCASVSCRLSSLKMKELPVHQQHGLVWEQQRNCKVWHLPQAGQSRERGPDCDQVGRAWGACVEAGGRGDRGVRAAWSSQAGLLLSRALPPAGAGAGPGLGGCPAGLPDSVSTALPPSTSSRRTCPSSVPAFRPRGHVFLSCVFSLGSRTHRRGSKLSMTRSE